MALKITELFARIQAEGHATELCSAIEAFMGARLDLEDESHATKLEAVLATAVGTAHEKELLGIFKRPTHRATLQDVLNDQEWVSVMDDQVLAIDAESTVSIDCLSIILRADGVMADMRDVDQELLFGVRLAVARQCEVFYFG